MRTLLHIAVFIFLLLPLNIDGMKKNGLEKYNIDSDKRLENCLPIHYARFNSSINPIHNARFNSSINDEDYVNNIPKALSLMMQMQGDSLFVDLTGLEFLIMNSIYRRMPQAQDKYETTVVKVMQNQSPSVQAFALLQESREILHEEDQQVVDAISLDKEGKPKIDHQKIHAYYTKRYHPSVQAFMLLQQSRGTPPEDRQLINAFSLDEKGEPKIDKKTIKAIGRHIKIFGLKIPRNLERLGLLGIGALGTLLCMKMRR